MSHAKGALLTYTGIVRMEAGGFCAAYLGLELGDTSSLVNPAAVEEIRKSL